MDDPELRDLPELHKRQALLREHKLEALRERSQILVAHLTHLREHELARALEPVRELLCGMGVCAGELHALYPEIGKHSVDMGGLSHFFDEERLLHGLWEELRAAYRRGYQEGRGDT